jgi:outer membrane protein assembly factor BamB
MTILALVSIAAGQMIKPPTHRVWTTVLSDTTEVQAVRNGVVYYTSQLSAGALDAQSGKSIWSQKFSNWSSKGAINRDSMFVFSQAEKAVTIYTINLKTGSPKKLATLMENNIDGYGCDDQRVYVIRGTTGTALDAKTGKVLWKKEYPVAKKKERSSLASVATGFGKVFFAIDNAGLHNIDPSTGKVIWKVSPEYGSYNPPILTPHGAITSFEGIQLLNYSNGKPTWSIHTRSSEVLAIMGNVLATKDNKSLVGFDMTSGSKLWQTTAPVDTASRSRGHRDQLPADNQGAMISDEGFFHVTSKGEVDWTIKPKFDGMPVYANGTMMVCNDGNRLLGYVSGASEPLPTLESDRKALALKMVESFENLDRGEREQIIALAKYATQPLIRKYVSWSKAYDAIERGSRSGLDMMLYGLLTETPEMLDEMCTADDTSALLKAIEDMGPKGQYQNEIKTVLGHKGDPSRVMPNYIASLKANRSNKRNRDDSAALDAIAHSSDPTAVSFMIDALKDPTAPSEWSHAAFIHLAGTGGAAGVEAVRQARAKPGPRPTWQEAFTESLGKGSVLTEAKDAKGRTWRLVQSYALGNGSDLFIQEKKGTSWDKPIFLSVYTGRTFSAKEPTSYKSIPMTKLIETEWVKIFPNDASLTKDSDGDGLTDLVEARLGTDPNKADTDGDGLFDSVDPCPTAAPRAMSDKEKIIAACVEAKFFGEGWKVPAIINVEGVTPFELYGYDSFLFWGSRREGSLGKMYGGGMNSIGFSPPMKDFNEDQRGKGLIEFSKDGKSAETMISRYSGGLNGEGESVKLIKVGDDWFVTDIQMRYVS